MTRPLISFFILAALSLAALSLVPVAANPPLRTEDGWEERIRQVGGRVAYAEFARAAEGLSIARQHAEVHVFGGALYDTEGVAGLPVCDSRFSFGCFHEFLGRAIAELGLSSTPGLNQACVDALGAKSLSCQHGIGHGVQAALGYTKEALDEALPLCRDLPYSDPIGGCYGGVFMEYNMRTMLGEDGTLRPYSGGAAEPCDVLPETYKRACFFWQPQWWHQVLYRGVGTEEAFRDIGALCDEHAPTYLMQTCFEGVGNVVPAAADFSADTARTLCEAASTVSELRARCLFFAANDIGITVGVDEGVRVCSALSGILRSHCLLYAHNKANILVPPGTQSSL